MTIGWPYKLALALLLLLVSVFIASPYRVINTLAGSVKNSTITVKKWQTQVQTPYLIWYTKKVLDRLLQTKVSLAMKNKEINKLNAMFYYMTTYSHLNKQANEIVSVKGFSHFLCGELARFPEYPAQHDSDCWVMDGAVQWQSLTFIRVSYKNPVSKWFSHLYLERTGLFDWQVVAVELPVEKMLVQLEQYLAEKG